MSSPYPDNVPQRTVVTRTTVTTTATGPEQSLYMNVAFLKTYHGYLKILEIIVCLLAFICVMSTGWPFNSIPAGNFISFVTVSGMIFSSLLLFLHFINAVVFFQLVPWILVELVYSGLWCFFCLVGGSVGASYANKYHWVNHLYTGTAGYAAGAFFLFVGMCIFGYAAYKLYLLHRQGVRLALVTTEITSRSVTTDPS